MTGETNPGLLMVLSGKHVLRGARGSLATGLAGWQKCSLQDAAVTARVTMWSFLKKVGTVRSSWVFLLPWLEEWTKRCAPRVLRT